MSRERYIVRPVWQVILVNEDGSEIVLETLPTEEAARAAATTDARLSCFVDPPISSTAEDCSQ